MSAAPEAAAPLAVPEPEPVEAVAQDLADSEAQPAQGENRRGLLSWMRREKAAQSAVDEVSEPEPVAEAITVPDMTEVAALPEAEASPEPAPAPKKRGLLGWARRSRAPEAELPVAVPSDTIVPEPVAANVEATGAEAIEADAGRAPDLPAPVVDAIAADAVAEPAPALAPVPEAPGGVAPVPEPEAVAEAAVPTATVVALPVGKGKGRRKRKGDAAAAEPVADIAHLPEPEPAGAMPEVEVALSGLAQPTEAPTEANPATEAPVAADQTQAAAPARRFGWLKGRKVAEVESAPEPVAEPADVPDADLAAIRAITMPDTGAVDETQDEAAEEATGPDRRRHIPFAAVLNGTVGAIGATAIGILGAVVSFVRSGPFWPMALMPLPLIAVASQAGGFAMFAVLLYVATLAMLMDDLVARASADRRGIALDLYMAGTVGAAFAATLFIGLAAASGWTGLGFFGKLMAFLATAIFMGQILADAAKAMAMSRDRRKRAIAAFMFSLVFLPQQAFLLRVIHRRFVATTNDPYTAEENETLYEFFGRAWEDGLTAGHEMGMALAKPRLGSRQGRIHPFLIPTIVSLTTLIAVPVLLGFFGLLAYLFLVPLVQLQIFGTLYVRHFGLFRGLLPGGRLKPLTTQHRRIGPDLLSRLAGTRAGQILGITRMAPGRGRSPVLPYPVPAMAALALIPPLWRRAFETRVSVSPGLEAIRRR
jgi:alkane 1-monooxygenase